MKAELMALVGNGKWIDALPKSNSVSWSSDKDTLGIQLTYLSLIDLVEGTHIQFKLDGKVTFTGIMVKKTKKKLSYSYTCFDYAWYLNKNEDIIQFNKVTADVAIKQLCTKFGIKCNCVKINYIVEEAVETTISNNTTTIGGTSIVTIAKKYLKVPYLWGGTTPKGFDCSGFIQYVFKQLKISITRTTYTQIKEGTAVKEKSLQPGDIVFFGVKANNPTHEALYIGSGNVIQAPSTGDVVKITPLKNMKNYITARRIKIPTAVAKATTKVTISNGTYNGSYANGLYKDWINTYAKKYGISPNLVSGIIWVESSFIASKVNPTSGATGLGQFLLSTANSEGLKNRKDAKTSIEHLCSYLKKVIGWNGGNISKGIMAYGEGTQAYLNKVIAATPGHSLGTTGSGTVTTTANTEDTTITTMVAKVYRDQALSAIIDDILANATLDQGTKFIREMIGDILYIRALREYKIFPTFMLQNDIEVNSTIEDMVNKVLVISSDDANNKILTTVSDPKNIAIYGGLQQILTVEKKDESHSKFIADKYLLANNKIFKDTTLNIVVLSGGEEIRSNRVMGVSIASMGVSGWYNVSNTSCQLINNQLKASITIEW